MTIEAGLGLAGGVSRDSAQFKGCNLNATAVGTSDTILATFITFGRSLGLQGLVGGTGNLTHLAIYTRRNSSAPAMLRLQDTDFNDPTVPNGIVRSAVPNNAYQLAAGNGFDILLDDPGVWQWELHATASASTVTVAIYVGIGTR